MLEKRLKRKYTCHKFRNLFVDSFQTADMGASFFALDNDRVQIMDFLVISLNGFSFLYKAPSIGPDLTGFVKPYTYQASIHWVGQKTQCFACHVND